MIPERRDRRGTALLACSRLATIPCTATRPIAQPHSPTEVMDPIIPTVCTIRAIRATPPSDWPAIRSIYLEGIATGDATFEADAPTWEEWDRAHLETCRLLATRADDVIGWAALSPVSNRCVYEGVAEVSVYVAGRARGQGVGTALLNGLIGASERAGLWTLESGIFPENVASLALHKACGFREVGHRERLGRMNDRWRDVVLLERRSPVVGSTPRAS